MATATKAKKSTKKAPKAKPQPVEEESSADRGMALAIQYADQVGEMRDNEMSYEDIATELGISKGSVMMGALIAKVTPKERVKFKDDEDLGTQIVDLRDNEQVSWGMIAARAQVPESKVRKLYTDTSGVDSKGLRIGRGGRFPAGMEPTDNGTATKPAKKAVKAKADPNPGRKNLGDMDLDEITARLEGKTVTIGRGAKSEKVGVKSVKDLEGGELTFVDAKGGKTRTVEVKNIVRASR